jgi:hypothetical protein
MPKGEIQGRFQPLCSSKKILSLKNLIFINFIRLHFELVAEQAGFQIALEELRRIVSSFLGSYEQG